MRNRDNNDSAGRKAVPAMTVASSKGSLHACPHALRRGCMHRLRRGCMHRLRRGCMHRLRRGSAHLSPPNCMDLLRPGGAHVLRSAATSAA
jgi:hypothetical protein